MHPSFCFLESCVFFSEVLTFLCQNPHFHFLLLLRGLRDCKNKEKNISFSLRIFVHMGAEDSDSGGITAENLTSDFVLQESLRLFLLGALYSRGYKIPPGLAAVTGAAA